MAAKEKGEEEEAEARHGKGETELRDALPQLQLQTPPHHGHMPLTQNQKQYIKLYVDKSMEYFSTGNELSINLDQLVTQLDDNVIRLDKYEERQQRIVECKTCDIKFDIIGLYVMG